MRFKASLEVLNFANGDEQKEAKAFIAQALNRVSYKKTKGSVHPHQSPKNLVRDLQEYINKRKPQLLVLFPEERSFMDKLFVKSRTERLSYISKIPLLTVRKSLIA
jgi:hypothetical protein